MKLHPSLMTSDEPKIDLPTWIDKAVARLKRKLPPGITVILLAHKDNEMTMRGNCCCHKAAQLIEGAKVLNNSVISKSPPCSSEEKSK